MTHSAKDLERACPDCYRVRESKPPRPKCAQNAQLIADVRREALEEAAMLVAGWPIPTSPCPMGERDLRMAAAIRALKDGAK